MNSKKSLLIIHKLGIKEHGKEEVNGKAFNHTVHNINANAGIEGTVKVN